MFSMRVTATMAREELQKTDLCLLMGAGYGGREEKNEKLVKIRRGKNENKKKYGSPEIYITRGSSERRDREVNGGCAFRGVKDILYFFKKQEKYIKETTLVDLDREEMGYARNFLLSEKRWKSLKSTFPAE